MQAAASALIFVACGLLVVTVFCCIAFLIVFRYFCRAICKVTQDAMDHVTAAADPVASLRVQELRESRDKDETKVIKTKGPDPEVVIFD